MLQTVNITRNHQIVNDFLTELLPESAEKASKIYLSYFFPQKISAIATQGVEQ